MNIPKFVNSTHNKYLFLWLADHINFKVSSSVPSKIFFDFEHQSIKAYLISRTLISFSHPSKWFSQYEFLHYIWKWKKFQSCFTNSLCRLESVGKPKKLGRVIKAAPNIMKVIIIPLYPFMYSFNIGTAKIKVATGVQEKMAEALPRGTCWNATKTDKISKPPQNPCENIWSLKKIMFI